MTPQQVFMIRMLKSRKISQVMIAPEYQFQIECAKTTLTEIGSGKFTATIEQLEAYYQCQAIQ